MKAKEIKPTLLFIIPHTHWEGAVFKTRAEYLEIGLPNILKALAILEKYPHYRFVLDQSCYVEPFLKKYPFPEGDKLKKFISEGRLEICGGTHVMLDVNMPCGESFVRQVLHAKGFFRKELGVEVTAGWQLDTFGHHAQMPQLLKLAGYTSFWFSRGVPDPGTPVEFLWEGIDGSRIPAFWVPYGDGYGSPQFLKSFTEFFQKKFDALVPRAKGSCRVILAGVDVAPPEEHLPDLAEKFNAQPDTPPFKISFAVPSEYEKEVSQKPERPIIKGELNPIFQGTYSSRIELKQKLRETENLLLAAEKLGVMLKCTGMSVRDDTLRQAWEPLLFNQAHDLMSGVMTDKVYEDTLKGYNFSGETAAAEFEKRLEEFVLGINTEGGEGQAIVVFNSLGWKRADSSSIEMVFTSRQVLDIKLFDPDNREVAVQLSGVERYDNETISKARVTFVAEDIPAFGYSVFRLKTFFRSPVTKPARGMEKENSMEGRYCSVELDSAAGTITKIQIKPDKMSVLGGSANVVVQEQDKGDFWELYRSLDGGSAIAMKDRHPAPKPGIGAVFSNQFKGRPEKTVKGSVYSEFEVTHLFGSGTFSTKIRLYRNLRRIEIRTRIKNRAQFVRYRALFPVAVGKSRSFHEIPFGAIERPDGIEFPAQNWIDHSGPDRGVALLNKGLPGNNVADSVMMLSLMRSTRITSYAFAGGYEEGMSSDTGLELEKELEFEYALVPHKGTWQEAGIFREGLEFNNPLICRLAGSHPGDLPARWGLLEISHPNIVVSALKQDEKGGLILRAYEAAGQPAENVEIKFFNGVQGFSATEIGGSASGGSLAKVVSAEEANLLEDSLSPIKVIDNTVSASFRPFEIKTFKIKF